MCDPVLQLCCTLIPGTLCLPSHPFESHLHLQFSLSQSPLRLLNSSEYQNYRGKKSVLQKPAAISSSSSPAQFSTHGSRKTKLILIHNSTSTAHSCNICPYLEQHCSPIKHREGIQGEKALKYVLKPSVNILECIPKHTGDCGSSWSVGEIHSTQRDPHPGLLQGGWH